MARFLRADDLFMAMCFLVGPMAVLAPNGLAVILVVGSVGLVLLEPVRLRLAHVARWPIYVLGLFAALAAASLAWTIDAGEGLDGWIRICSTALLGLVWIDKAIALDGSARTRADRALVYGMLASLGMLAGQAVSVALSGWEGSLVTLFLQPDQQPWSFFNRGIAVFACLVPLAAARILQHFGPVPGAAFALVAGGTVFLFNSKAAELAICVAFATFVAFLLSRRVAPRILAAMLAAIVLLMPFAAMQPVFGEIAERRDLSVSIYHRAAIWQFVAERIEEKPLLGWGLHASRSMPGAKELVARGAEILPLHPHNGPLQLWLELGAIGAVLGAALLAWLARNAASAAQAAALTAMLAVGSVSFGLWQGWWMAAIWLVVGLAVGSSAETRQRQTAC
jgi:exopolysaccharide production protein ExoQ